MAINTSATTPMVSRLGDATVAGSPANLILAPRKFSAVELSTLASELRKIDQLLTSMSEFVIAHRSQAYSISSTGADKTKFEILVADAAKSISIDQLTIEGVSFVSEAKTAVTSTLAAGVVTTVSVKSGSTVVASLTENTYAIHSFLASLPAAIYNAAGGLIEEVATSYYRGTGVSQAITAEDRMSIIKLQAKQAKSIAQSASNVAIIGKDGPIPGVDDYRGKALARIHAQNVARIVAPMISEWIWDHVAPGEALLSTAMLSG